MPSKKDLIEKALQSGKIPRIGTKVKYLGFNADPDREYTIVSYMVERGKLKIFINGYDRIYGMENIDFVIDFPEIRKI